MVFHWAQIRDRWCLPSPIFFQVLGQQQAPQSSSGHAANENKDLQISSHPNSIQDPIWVMREYHKIASHIILYCIILYLYYLILYVLLKLRVSPHVSTDFRRGENVCCPRCSKSWRPTAEDSSCPRPLRLGSWQKPGARSSPTVWPKTTETI